MARKDSFLGRSVERHDTIPAAPDRVTTSCSRLGIGAPSLDGADRFRLFECCEHRLRNATTFDLLESLFCC